MIIAIVILSIFLTIALTLLVSILFYLNELKQQISSLTKEQFIQNEELDVLLKYKSESTLMLLQHIEILKYLVERDPTLTERKEMFYFGPKNEA